MPISEFDKFLDEILTTEDFVKVLSVRTVDGKSTEYRIDNQNINDTKATHHNLQMQVKKEALCKHVTSLKRAGFTKSTPTVATVLVHRQIPHTYLNLGEGIRYAFHQTSCLGPYEDATTSPKTLAEWEAIKASRKENKNKNKNDKGTGGGKGAGGKAT
ncbi:hypothetical protein MMC11_009125 [Xylographa trunciseda]|nr:hypothetical protein [Xylographa trunciseda]